MEDTKTPVPENPPTAVQVVADDSETRKKIKKLEDKQSWLETQLEKVTTDKNSLEDIVRKGQATPAAHGSPQRNAWESFLADIGLIS